MKVSRRNPERLGKFAAAAIALGLFFPAKIFSAETVTFHLRTGERIVGAIVSQNTNRVVISNLWAGDISVPLAQIEKRKTNVVAASTKKSAVSTNVNARTTKVAAKSSAKNVAAAVPAVSKTNLVSSPVKPPKAKLWHAQVDIGVDSLYGAKDRQIYNGRLKHTYARPYAQSPGKFFRNTADYLFEYAETDGVLSGNRMEGSDKIDFDVGKKFFLYNLGAAGYDEIRKIDLRYELGPGVGYHLLALTNFVMNVEGGANYQVQDRTALAKDVKNFYFRFAEDFTWKLPFQLKTLPNVTLTEKLEFFPRAEDPSEYRARFESKLSFPLLKNVTFNFSVIDLYDTQPASNISKNELQVRSSVGVAF